MGCDNGLFWLWRGLLLLHSVDVHDKIRLLMGGFCFAFQLQPKLTTVLCIHNMIELTKTVGPVDPKHTVVSNDKTTLTLPTILRF